MLPGSRPGRAPFLGGEGRPAAARYQPTIPAFRSLVVFEVLISSTPKPTADGEPLRPKSFPRTLRSKCGDWRLSGGAWRPLGQGRERFAGQSRSGFLTSAAARGASILKIRFAS